MARVNVQASSAPQQGLPFLNSLPLMLANVVFPLTQHLASGGTPVGKVGAGEGGGQRERVMPTQSSKGRSATFPNQPDTCFGKTGPKLKVLLPFHLDRPFVPRKSVIITALGPFLAALPHLTGN